MSFGSDDLGVLGNLAKALGIFKADGSANTAWFGNPEASLKTVLANPAQREALIAFVDEAMQGADRSTQNGVVWLPIVDIDEPPLSVAITVDDRPADGLHIGVGLRVTTTSPDSATTLAVPLFRAQKEGGPSVSQPLLLGSPGGRIRLGTEVTIADGPAVPGTARIGAIGIEIDLPTAPGDPAAPVFALSLTGLQLPGATSPRDIRVAADGVDELDDAVLDLVLALVKSQADAAPVGSPIASVGGLLGLRSDDRVPDFPITQLPTRGALALADWVRGILTSDDPRHDWLDHLKSLLGGTRSDDTVLFALGGSAALKLRLRVDTGPTGHACLTPTLGVLLGNTTARVEAAADLFRIDLVTGAATAFPSLGLWAAAGGPGAGNRVLDLAAPTVVRADTLRLGFALDPLRRLTFVLAADGVRLGTHDYPTLDLTSPDAVMDAASDTVGDIANDLLDGLGDALRVVRQLIGLDAPPGVTAVTLGALMADPVTEIGAYWQRLVGVRAAAEAVLGSLRRALMDDSARDASLRGSGVAGDPWQLPLIGPLALEFAVVDAKLEIGVAGATSVDTLGERCTVIDTRIAALLARIDFAARSASLLPGFEGVLAARERGASPKRARLVLSDAAALEADHVGLRLAWSPALGLQAGISAPNLRLDLDGAVLPVALPTIAADGSVTLPPAAWDGVQHLVGHLGELIGGVLGDAVRALGWSGDAARAGGDGGSRAALRLAELIADPPAALGRWLPQLAMSELGPQALDLLADLLGHAAGLRGVVHGQGAPDAPYRVAFAPGLPELAVWLPPAGPEPLLFAAPENLREWRPGAPGLSIAALAAALRAEAGVAADVRALAEGRDLAGGFTALTQRWLGGDGRIVAPPTTPPGIELRRIGLGASQLIDQLDLEDLTGRVPTTTVHIALGAAAWPAAPAGRRIDLATPGLAAAMFAAPTAATGDWFVALGTRADCRVTGDTSASDGTPEQAARLARVLDALATVSSDIAVVAVAGAGHAARLAAQAQPAVTDLVLLGTPLAPISLTALAIQPTADALRLLDRLLPPPPDPAAGDAPEDDDLALGRALVRALMDLAPLADPGADLRLPAAGLPDPRAGLSVVAQFGEVDASQILAGMTAILAAGLAARAHRRAARPLVPPTGVAAGLHWALPADASGTLAISAEASLALFAVDRVAGAAAARTLRVRVRIGDRLGWIAATPELELRAVSIDLTLPLDGTSAGQTRLVLHEARVFGQSWEALTLGNVDGAVPVLPEARVLLASAVQRLTADLGGTASLALSQLLRGLGLIGAGSGAGSGVVGDAFDQLVHDPAGLVRQRLALAGPAIAAALSTLLGPLGASVDLAARTVRVQGGGPAAGRFGWHADLLASPTGVGGHLRIGPDAALPVVGGLQLRIDLSPLQVAVHWHQPGGTTDTVPLWPAPDAAALARVLARAAPSLGGHAALELMRRADASARPIIDAALDALGLLGGAAGDAERALRPLAGLISDPAGWLRSAGSLASSPVRIQALFDAFRPLMGLAGAPGEPLRLATGVSVTVAADGPARG